VVHARASGAFGEFEVTHDVSDITSAAFLNGIGNKSRCLLRVSTVGPEAGSADSVRDVRGFALKIYTEEGNQDFVFNDMPVFFVRDPIKFPSLNRSHKRHPATGLPDASMFWDFHNGNPEGYHALMHLFGDRGTPKSIRHVHGFSGHAYKLTKEDGTFKYVKFTFRTNQGIQNNTNDEATRVSGESPDYHRKDLWEAIDNDEYPSWTFYVQVMAPEQAESYRWNIFDMTKVWPHADFPLRQVGRFTLNENPSNYFRDIEQAAFSPSTMVPGIAPSADPMLQARMFAYPDAARYRLGVNYQQLPPNAPRTHVYTPYQRDGFSTFGNNYGGDPNYVNSSFKAVHFKGQLGAHGTHQHEEWTGKVSAFTSRVTDEDFVQAKGLWDVMGKQKGQQDNFVYNVSVNLKDAVPHVQGETFKNLSRIDTELGRRIKEQTLIFSTVTETLA